MFSRTDSGFIGNVTGDTCSTKLINKSLQWEDKVTEVTQRQSANRILFNVAYKYKIYNYSTVYSLQFDYMYMYTLCTYMYCTVIFTCTINQLPYIGYISTDEKEVLYQILND